MKRFNLRAYAIIVNDYDEVLVSDELRFGESFTKFPGGGLEWGEGTQDTVKRELKEELGLDAEIGELFYVNSFFQQSAFKQNDQLISFYYKVSVINFDEIPTTNHTIPLTEEGEKFRWISRLLLSEDMFRFPLDKLVAKQLLEL